MDGALIAEPLARAYASVFEIPGTWIAAFVKANHEQALLEEMALFGLQGYAPQTYRKVKIGGKERTRLEPAFRNYTFISLRGEKPQDSQAIKDLYTIRGSRHVVGRKYLPIAQQARFRKELSQIQKALEIDPFLSQFNHCKPGTPVRIKSGAFVNFEGILEKFSNGKVSLRLSFFGDMPIKEFDPADLEIINEGSTDQN